jgi:phytoene/squalene synthetase
MNASATLARAITWAGSKQTYLTARLLADRDLADDCLRAYAYFRWADDVVDISSQTKAERIAFIQRQEMLIERLYCGKRPDNLSPEEQILADLIAHDRGTESGLHSFIRNFMAVIEFDACRKGKVVSQRELVAYSSRLATAVMDGIQYFIGNGHPYPQTPQRNLAVIGAHITHMLRDLCEDLPAGFINIPAESFASLGHPPWDVESEPFRDWVRGQVGLARDCFREGRLYIETLDVLRCKLAGIWYCARFERILDVIEGDGYRLRAAYPEQQALVTWLEFAGLGLVVALKHFAGRLRHRALPTDEATQRLAV